MPTPAVWVNRTRTGWVTVLVDPDSQTWVMLPAPGTGGLASVGYSENTRSDPLAVCSVVVIQSSSASSASQWIVYSRTSSTSFGQTGIRMPDGSAPPCRMR